MTSFEDGPAKGEVLNLERIPRFLRVTRDNRSLKFDALDQLDDEPRAGETLIAYEIVGRPGMIHIDRRGKGAHSSWHKTGHYRMVENQPTDAEMRTIEGWKAWCMKAAGIDSQKLTAQTHRKTP